MWQSEFFKGEGFFELFDYSDHFLSAAKVRKLVLNTVKLTRSKFTGPEKNELSNVQKKKTKTDKDCFYHGNFFLFFCEGLHNGRLLLRWVQRDRYYFSPSHECFIAGTLLRASKQNSSKVIRAPTASFTVRRSGGASSQPASSHVRRLHGFTTQMAHDEHTDLVENVMEMASGDNKCQKLLAAVLLAGWCVVGGRGRLVQRFLEKRNLNYGTILNLNG